MSESAAQQRLAAICRSAARILAADGAAVTLMAENGPGLAHATDRTADVLEREQQVCGEGPSLTAFALQAPVIVDDLRGVDARLGWPLLAQAMNNVDVGRFLALPVAIGGIRLGVLSIYSRLPGILFHGQLSAALLAADGAGLALLDAERAADGGGPGVVARTGPGLSDSPGNWHDYGTDRASCTRCTEPTPRQGVQGGRPAPTSRRRRDRSAGPLRAGEPMTAQSASERQNRVERMFVLLADTLTEDFDISDTLDQLAHACVELLGATAAGILLADPGTTLRVVAASNESSRLLEAIQVQGQSGPCLEAYATGRPVGVPDLAGAADRWPEFVERAGALGFASVHAFPMRLRSEVIGAVNLFHASRTTLAADNASVAQALADIATISLIQMRLMRESAQVAEQLQLALNSRIVIEQAKGMLAEVGRLEMGRAFDALRRYARDRNLRLTAVAETIVNRELPTDVVLKHGAGPR